MGVNITSFRHLKRKQGLLWTCVSVLGIISLILVTLSQSWDLIPRERFITQRFLTLLFLSAVSFLPPHRLFPDPREPMLRVLNLSPIRLFLYLIWHERIVLSVFFTISLSVGWGSTALWTFDHIHQLTAALSLALVPPIMYIYALLEYLRVGVRSQRWREGERGKNWRESSTPISAATVPTLAATIRLMVIAWMLIILLAYLSGRLSFNLDTMAILIFGSLLAFKYSRIRPTLLQHYYQAHGFYRDYILGGRSSREEREPVTYDQIYWVPHTFRASVWMLIRQMERRFPYGRLIIIGHFVLWVIWYAGASDWIKWGYLSLFTLAQIGATIFTANEQIAPPGRFSRMHGFIYWIITRLFVQLRWIAPFIISLSLIALLNTTFTKTDVSLWSLFYLAGVIAMSAIVTWLHEGRFKQQFQS